MKYSVAVAAFVGASSVTAAPFTAEKRGFFDTVGNYFPGAGSVSSGGGSVPSGGGSVPSGGSNAVQDALNAIIAGGAPSSQVIPLLQDESLASHALATIKKTETSTKVKKLLSNQQFLTGPALAGINETFINQVARYAGNTTAYTQSAQLAGNTDFLGFLSGIIGDKAIFSALTGALTKSNFDLGNFITSNAQSPATWNLVGNVAGSDYANIVAKLEALFNDKVFAARFDALLSSQNNFDEVLKSTLTDADFITHVCNVLEIAPELTTKIVALLGNSANFGAGLEGLLGSAFKGQITGVIGTGSASSLVDGAFGGLGSFNAIISKYLSSGAIVSAIGSLLGNSSFTGTFTSLVNGFLSGNLDLSAIIKQVTANLPFLSQITGALAIPFSIVQTVVSTITASGLFKVVFDLFGQIY